MDELLDAVGRPGAVPENAAAVTFDDGFANNLAVGEIMLGLRLPWSVFVSTGEIGDGRAMWLVEFSLLVMRGEAARLEMFGQSWPLTARADRERAFRELRPRLKTLPAGARGDAMQAARAQFPDGESTRLVAAFPSLRILSWRELSELSGSGVEVGSHGVHHDMHHSGQPSSERMRELCESRREIETRLGRPCRAFAYPNGDHVAESPAEAESAGYRAAFTTDPRAAGPEDSRYLLPRMTPPESMERFVRDHWFIEQPEPRAAASGQRSPAR